jgi:hypothetical protein
MAKTREERRAARAARKQEAADRQNDGACGALQRQVGGSHYLSGIQHVQFCQENRIPWCESAAIKYILRHRRKNGREDIEKAIHYLELLMALDYARRPEGEERTDMNPKKFTVSIKSFLDANSVPEPERECIQNICNHQFGGGDGGKGGLMYTVKLLQGILADYGSADMDLL